MLKEEGNTILQSQVSYLMGSHL